MTATSAPLPDTERGNLLLGHVLAATGVNPKNVLAIRHTFTSHGLTGPTALTTESVLEYTRRQVVGRFGATQPRLWLTFVHDGGARSRFIGTFTNNGEAVAERTADHLCFDLEPSEFLGSLRDRLVVEWSGMRSWFRRGELAALFPLVEIADPAEVPFPGFDAVRIDFATLRKVVEDRRYRSWQVALGSVQGIYLIADCRSGKTYVGKADGSERILGRWAAYARTGHGGNIGLTELLGAEPDRSHDFQFSLLRVFGPSTPTAEIDAAEEHYKRALLTREFGYNRN